MNTSPARLLDWIEPSGEVPVKAPSSPASAFLPSHRHIHQSGAPSDRHGEAPLTQSITKDAIHLNRANTNRGPLRRRVVLTEMRSASLRERWLEWGHGDGDFRDAEIGTGRCHALIPVTRVGSASGGIVARSGDGVPLAAAV